MYDRLARNDIQNGVKWEYLHGDVWKPYGGRIPLQLETEWQKLQVHGKGQVVDALAIESRVRGVQVRLDDERAALQRQLSRGAAARIDPSSGKT